MQAFSFSNLNHFATASLITRLTNDVTMLQNTIFMGLRIMARAPLMILGGVILALMVNVRLALYICDDHSNSRILFSLGYETRDAFVSFCTG